MAYFSCGPYQLFHSRAYTITATEVTGGGRVLPIWLEELLGDVKLYVRLVGENILKIAATIMGSGLSLSDLTAAAHKADKLRPQQPRPGFMSRLLGLNR